MPAKKPCRRKLTELVSYKVLRNVNGNPGFSVVYRNGKTDHLRDDSRAPGVCFDHFLVSRLSCLDDSLVKLLLYKRTFLYGSRHDLLLFPSLYYMLVGVLFLLSSLVPLCWNAPGRDGMPPTGSLPFTTTVGVIHRIHYYTTNFRSSPKPP